MFKLFDWLLSPNVWVLIASLLGIGGLVCIVTGLLTGSHTLMYSGIWLLIPLFLGGALLVVIVIPLLVVANQKHNREE
jgi:hypothetical protein